jgi:hypothetical protein
MASLNINDKTAESLAARAAAEGISVDEALQRLLRSGTIVRTEPPIAVVELDALLDQELTDAPLLPADFSRADIYADHD